MSDPAIITPTSAFPDQDILDRLANMDLRVIRGDGDGQLPGFAYETADGSTVLRYLQDPDLEIPVIVVDGDQAQSLAIGLCKDIPHFPAAAAGLAFDPAASSSVKFTLLKILSAHALAEVTPAMTRAVTLAVVDPSPFIRLAGAQLFRYAQTVEMAEIIRHMLVRDPDPDVRRYASEALANFDDANGDN